MKSEANTIVIFLILFGLAITPLLGADEYELWTDEDVAGYLVPTNSSMKLCIGATCNTAYEVSISTNASINNSPVCTAANGLCAASINMTGTTGGWTNTSTTTSTTLSVNTSKGFTFNGTVTSNVIVPEATSPTAEVFAVEAYNNDDGSGVWAHRLLTLKTAYDSLGPPFDYTSLQLPSDATAIIQFGDNVDYTQDPFFGPMPGYGYLMFSAGSDYGLDFESKSAVNGRVRFWTQTDNANAFLFSAFNSTAGEYTGKYVSMLNNDIEIFNISGTGNVWTSGAIGINDVTPDAEVDVQIGSSTTKGLLVQGAAAQSANPFEVQDSTGAHVASIQADGDINVSNWIYFGAAGSRRRIASASDLIYFQTDSGGSVRVGGVSGILLGAFAPSYYDSAYMDIASSGLLMWNSVAMGTSRNVGLARKGDKELKIIDNSTGYGDLFLRNMTLNGLNGTGNAYACLDANGKLYRSGTPCA